MRSAISRSICSLISSLRRSCADFIQQVPMLFRKNRPLSPRHPLAGRVAIALHYQLEDAAVG
jgi:hypothetical protein